MFPVVWHKRAGRERKNILRYWILHNGSDSYARKLNAEIKHIQKLLSENPEMGTISEMEGIRFVIILRNFSLYYQFKSNQIQILSLWDNRRNPEDFEIYQS